MQTTVIGYHFPFVNYIDHFCPVIYSLSYYVALRGVHCIYTASSSANDLGCHGYDKLVLVVCQSTGLQDPFETTGMVRKQRFKSAGLDRLMGYGD